MSIPTDHGVIDKRSERAEIERQTRKFLKGGGKIDRREIGERAGDTVNQYAERNRQRARVLKNNGDLFGHREAT